MFEQAFRNIDDVLRKEAGCTTELDYVKADGDLSNYYPDFVVKLSDASFAVVETKGQEDTDTAPKMERLRQWCEDINRVQPANHWDFVYVDEASFKKYAPKTFAQLLGGFREYKEPPSR